MKQFAIRLWRRIFPRFARSEVLEQEQIIRDHVRAAGPGGIRKRELHKKLYRLDSETFNRRVRWMTGEGADLREEKPPGSKSTYLFLNR